MRYLHLLAFVLILLAPGAFAQPASGASTVIAENSVAKLTRADYEAELTKLPQDMRSAFGNDPKRVVALVNNLLLMKTLAAQARTTGLDQKPDVQERVGLEVDRALAQLQVDAIEKRAGEEFDANPQRFETRAREIYRIEAAKFAVPETVSVSQIVFLTAKHGADGAQAAARDAVAKLRAGADFATLARELSDDPAAKRNGGELGWFAAQAVEPDFAKAAFDLKKTGDISDPVQTRYGWHVLRLDGRRPAGQRSFDDARKDIYADLRKQYVESKRDEAFAAIRNDPKARADESAVDTLLSKIDPSHIPTAPLIPYAGPAPK